MKGFQRIIQHSFSRFDLCQNPAKTIDDRRNTGIARSDQGDSIFHCPDPRVEQMLGVEGGVRIIVVIGHIHKEVGPPIAAGPHRFGECFLITNRGAKGNFTAKNFSLAPMGEKIKIP